MDFVLPLSTIVLSYLAGAIPFGLLVARAYGISDVRSVGSGNIGATNVWRSVGAKAGVIVFVFDIGKGLTAILVAQMIEQSIVSQELFLIFCAAAVVLGHVFPVYLQFRGGKGVNTALGAFGMLLPREVGIAIVIFIIVVLITRFISLGSISAALGMFIVILIEKFYLSYEIANIYLVVSFLMALLIIITHRKNIGRLISGNENKFSLGTAKSESHSSV